MSNNEITYLGSGFSPSDLDVIVGRGKVCYKHSGNLRLGRIVQSVLATYSASEATKKSKTELIKSIVSQVRETSPNGGFVKFDSEKGEWFEVGDRTAREKVSQAFRDSLTDQYKSSSTSKTLKRRQERITRQVSGDGCVMVPQSGEPRTPGGTLYEYSADPVASLPFGNMSIGHASPRVNAANSMRALPSPSPRAHGHGSFTMPSPSPRHGARQFNVPSPSPRASFSGSFSGTSLGGLASPGANSLMGNLVSPMSAGFNASPAMSARFSASPLTMSLAAQNAGLGAMNESPSSIRLAMAIAERKRRLTNLNMIMAARGRGPGGPSLGGLGRPQVPQF